PEDFFTTGGGAEGGSAEGGREELEEFRPGRASSSRTRASRVVSCCCKAAITASRSRHPGQTGSLMLLDYEAGQPVPGQAQKSGEGLPFFLRCGCRPCRGVSCGCWQKLRPQDNRLARPGLVSQVY